MFWAERDVSLNTESGVGGKREAVPPFRVGAAISHSCRQEHPLGAAPGASAPSPSHQEQDAVCGLKEQSAEDEGVPRKTTDPRAGAAVVGEEMLPSCALISTSRTKGGPWGLGLKATRREGRKHPGWPQERTPGLTECSAAGSEAGL